MWHTCAQQQLGGDRWLSRNCLVDTSVLYEVPILEVAVSHCGGQGVVDKTWGNRSRRRGVSCRNSGGTLVDAMCAHGRLPMIIPPSVGGSTSCRNLFHASLSLSLLNICLVEPMVTATSKHRAALTTPMMKPVAT
jgi:hypothetical protein